MTLIETIQQFEKIHSDSSSRRVQKACQKFINTLKSLEERNFNSNESNILKEELRKLDFKRFVKGSAIRKSYRHFLNSLQQKLSLTPKNYYSSRFGAIGLNLGVFLGIVILGDLERSLGIAVGLAIGMAIGYLYGKSLDQEAEAAQKVLS